MGADKTSGKTCQARRPRLIYYGPIALGQGHLTGVALENMGYAEVSGVARGLPAVLVTPEKLRRGGAKAIWRPRASIVALCFKPHLESSLCPRGVLQRSRPPGSNEVPLGICWRWTRTCIVC